MNAIKFERMYQDVIRADYANDVALIKSLLNFGGKDKLQQILFDTEKILAIAEAMKEGSVASFILDNILVLTNKRLLFLEKKLFGTLVTEIALKKAIASMEWSNNNLHVKTSEGYLNVYVFESGIDNVKDVLYEDYTEADYDRRFKVKKPKQDEKFERKLNAAKSGDSSAMVELAVAYEKGLGVQRNYKTALDWYIKAAEAGNVDAMFEVACKYAIGTAGEQSAKKSFKWCMNAAEKGNSDAMLILGYAYAGGNNGVGGYGGAFWKYLKFDNNLDVHIDVLIMGSVVDKDDEKAALWFKRAAEKGCSKADKELKLLIETTQNESLKAQTAEKVISVNRQFNSLKKGQRADLTQGNPGLKKLIVGLGWDTNKYDGEHDFDLDAAAFLLGANGKVIAETDFIFYNNPLHDSGAVEHKDENLKGAGEGDEEQIKIDLSKVPVNIEKIAFTVTIHEAKKRRQNFGQVSNAFIRIVDEASGKKILRYDLGEDFSTETAVVVGELYRNKGEWKFNAVGAGFNGGLAALCNNFGIAV